MSIRILVADDEPGICDFLVDLLSGPGRTFERAHDVGAAMAELRKTRFDLVLSDIHFSTEPSAPTGIDLLRAIKADSPETDVVLMSGFGTLETAMAAVKAGAYDYVSKPFDITELATTVDRALKQAALDRSGQELAQRTPSTRSTQTQESVALLGRSRRMLEVYKQIARAAPGSAPILILGETGVGKELVARALHQGSAVAAGAFVPLNCGALAEGVLESELFGHARGAFTGAVADKKGVFEQANGGTLFLDEIGDMPLALQVKLLRALQEGEVRPVGGTKNVSVKVRVVAATHRDVRARVADGSFRSDLYYRLRVIEIAVPPLRERPEDVPLLVDAFLARYRRPDGERARLTDRALAQLAAYAWPGNVRELENLIEGLVQTCPARRIDAEDLPAETQARAERFEESAFSSLPTLDEIERLYLLHVLAATGGNKSRAAETLGIDRRTLYRMAERFKISLGDSQEGGDSQTPGR